MKIGRKEFAVLSQYYDDYLEDTYRPTRDIAARLGYPVNATQSIISDLRAEGLIAGARKFRITNEGVAAYNKINDYLKAKAAGTEPQAQPTNPATAEPEQQAPVPAASEEPEEEAGGGEEPSGESTVPGHGSDPSPAVIPAATPEPTRQAAKPRHPSETDPGQGVVVKARTQKLSELVADRWSVTPSQLWNVIKSHVISVGRREDPPNDAEIMHVMSVMAKYDLDPFMKQIHAFRHKGKLHVSVGYDGWVALANRVRAFKGVTYEFPDEMVTTPGGKKCWPWVKATCHVEGKEPAVAFAFLEEWYVEKKPTQNYPNPADTNWDKYPTHRLRTKAYTLSVREGLGIELYDDSDVEQFKQISYEELPETKTQARTEEVVNVLAARAEAGSGVVYMEDEDE